MPGRTPDRPIHLALPSSTNGSRRFGEDRRHGREHGPDLRVGLRVLGDRLPIGREVQMHLLPLEHLPRGLGGLRRMTAGGCRRHRVRDGDDVRPGRVARLDNGAAQDEQRLHRRCRRVGLAPFRRGDRLHPLVVPHMQRIARMRANAQYYALEEQQRREHQNPYGSSSGAVLSGATGAGGCATGAAARAAFLKDARKNAFTSAGLVTSTATLARSTSASSTNAIVSWTQPRVTPESSARSARVTATSSAGSDAGGYRSAPSRPVSTAGRGNLTKTG